MFNVCLFVCFQNCDSKGQYVGVRHEQLLGKGTHLRRNRSLESSLPRTVPYATGQ